MNVRLPTRKEELISIQAADLSSCPALPVKSRSPQRQASLQRHSLARGLMSHAYQSLILLFLGSLARAQNASNIPTSSPFLASTDGPSSRPSFTNNVSIRQTYRSSYLIPESRFFTTQELAVIMTQYQNYTPKYSSLADQIQTACIANPDTMSLSPCAATPDCVNQTVLDLDYACTWISRTVTVTSLPSKYLNFSTSNLALLTKDLMDDGLNITGVLDIRKTTVATPSPTSGTISPTRNPTARPTVTPQPTMTHMPSMFPTRSVAPSSSPTVSPRPTARPSAAPTITPLPTHRPSVSPTDRPSSQPSDQPSSVPTFTSSSFVRQVFRQSFLVPDRRTFNQSEVHTMMMIFESYTYAFAQQADRVNTTCFSTDQQIVLCADNPNCQNASQTVIEMQYQCSWGSFVLVVDSFPTEYFNYVNGNTTAVTQDLQSFQLPVIQAFEVRLVFVATPVPTVTPKPTGAPSSRPTVTSRPTVPPSQLPSPMPMVAIPSLLPSTPHPSSQPARFATSKSGLSVGAVAGIVIIAGLAAFAGLLFYYRQRRKNRNDEAAMMAYRPSPGVAYGGDRFEGDSDAGVALISPVDSLASGKSLLSAPASGYDDSGDEMDNTRNLQDEFDRYKDQNLEQLRSGVEGNVANFEGIMSAAVTNALMGGNGEPIDREELLWGCRGTPSAEEIEASALCEVNDWLKRNENASLDRKRAFMQEMLNKMVRSVRFGILPAEDASRTIHESSALLGLQLAHELPMTTVLVSGMRKTVVSSQLTKTMREFGEIDVAAVASKQRGFGIVRFRQPKAVDRAMQRYRNGEIVVQDVAVQMKVLTPSGRVESRIVPPGPSSKEAIV